MAAARNMISSSTKRWVGRLLPWALLVIALVLMFSEVSNPDLLRLLGTPWARAGALAIVMTAIILTGGIDLSVGSMIGLSSMVMGVLWKQGWSIPLAGLAAVIVGIAAGSANGGLVVIGLPPLVATLATMAFYFGLSMVLYGAEQRITGMPNQWAEFAGVPTEYWILLVTFLTALFVIHHTRFGRWCYAIGENPLAARFAAVPVKRTQWFLYAASGLVAGLLAVVYTIRDGAIPDAHRGIELKAITCVVVGGTLITGGRGGIPLTLLGLAVIANIDLALGFVSARVDVLKGEGRMVVIGVLLISVATWNEWTASDESRRT